MNLKQLNNTLSQSCRPPLLKTRCAVNVEACQGTAQKNFQGNSGLVAVSSAGQFCIERPSRNTGAL